MKTVFTRTFIETEFGVFHFDGNSKVTCDEGTYDEPAPNCFSLVQVLDCPGSTVACREECYVHGLQKHDPILHNKYVLNSINLRRALNSPKEIGSLVAIFAEWIDDNVNNQFRWHVSGDIFSYAHAVFIRDVCYSCPDINFWIYTRSFDFAFIIRNVPNLIVNLSLDIDNYKEGRTIAKNHNFRITYLTTDEHIPLELPPGSVIFPSYQVRGRDLDDPTSHEWWRSLSPEYRKMVCPPDFFGQSEKLRCGPCKRCLVK